MPSGRSCFVSQAPRLAFTTAYNTSYHTTLQTTPFKLVYGRDPPRLPNYTEGHSKVEDVDQALVDHT